MIWDETPVAATCRYCGHPYRPDRVKSGGFCGRHCQRRFAAAMRAGRVPMLYADAAARLLLAEWPYGLCKRQPTTKGTVILIMQPDPRAGAREERKARPDGSVRGEAA